MLMLASGAIMTDKNLDSLAYHSDVGLYVPLIVHTQNMIEV